MSVDEEISVLYVDSDAASADRAKRSLEERNERVVVETAHSADAGLAALADWRPDCVVSEYDLPETDGIVLFDAVQDRYPELPLVLYTGAGSEDVAARAVSAGVTDYVQKRPETDQSTLLSARIEDAVATDRSRRAVEQQHERFALFFEASPLGAIQWDEAFRFCRLNERATEILGYDEAELRGDSWERIVPETDRDHVGDAVDDLLSADGGRHVVNRNVTADGEIRTIEWHNRTVTDADGTIQSIFSKFQDITERETRKQELKRYETIVQTLSDAVYVVDETGRFTYVNDQFVDLVGYDRETLVGSTPSLIKSDSGTERAERELARLLSDDGPETASFEVTIHPRDGDPIVCVDHMKPLPYDGEAFEGSVGTLRDITDRKERKRRLQDERDRFQSVFDDAFDAMAIVNDDGQYVEVNEQMTELFGVSKLYLVGRQIGTFTPDDLDIEATWRAFQASGQARGTVPITRSDGTERLVEYVASADIVSGQHLLIFRDVTERRRRERRFQALAEKSNDVISIVDTDGRFQYQSPSIERILGYDPDETVGDLVWNYIHPDDCEATRDWFEAWVDDSHRALDGIEYRARHADGSWRWMAASGNDQIDNPAVEGYVLNSRDITERKERRQQLDLLNRMLRHNMRNNMNVIRGAAEIIRNRATDAPDQFVERIIETSNSLIAKAEKQREMASLLRSPPELEAITVESLLQRVASGVRSDYPEATVVIDCPDGTTIRATEAFDHAVRELVTNAIVHSDADAPEVVVSVVQTADTVRIEIADDGPCIPETERAVLLGEAERTQLNHGSGFGLWLTQLLVSRSGGSIAFEQNAPTGNVVVLELPA